MIKNFYYQFTTRHIQCPESLITISIRNIPLHNITSQIQKLRVKNTHKRDQVSALYQKSYKNNAMTIKIQPKKMAFHS